MVLGCYSKAVNTNLGAFWKKYVFVVINYKKSQSQQQEQQQQENSDAFDGFDVLYSRLTVGPVFIF